MMKQSSMIQGIIILSMSFYFQACSDIDYPADVLNKSPFDMSGGNIVIDDGEHFAYSRRVRVNSHVDNAVQMQYSTDLVHWSEREPFTASRLWVLPLQYGEHTVFGQFVNSRGDTVMYSDAIVFIERLVSMQRIYLGGDTAISDDGTVVAVGSYEGSANAVYVFRKQEIDWECTVLKPDGIQPGDRCGFSVALSGDGRWLFAGAPVKKAVYVYEYSNGWQLQQTITAAGTSFGYDIAVDREAVYAAIASFDSRRVDIFTRNASNHYISRQAFIYAGYSPCSVTLSRNAQALFVGMVDANGAGRLAVFQNNAGSFNTLTTVVPSDNQQYAYFGHSVSVTSDGSLCVVGVPGYDISADDDKGCVYVYQRSGNAYVLIAQEKNATGSNGDALGKAVGITGDGGYIAVSMPMADAGGVDRGKVLVYRIHGTSLENAYVFYPDDRSERCYYGNSLGVSNNGVAAIGAPYAYLNDHGDNGGVVYIRRIE